MLFTDPTYALDPENRVFWQHLGTALLCGGLIGIERQLRGKAAGIRTSILICMGTAIFVVLGASINATHVDPTRVIAQITSGIGHLQAAIVLTLVTLGVLIGVELLEGMFRRLRQGATDRELDSIELEQD